MKVAELIHMLSQENPDAVVKATGCSQCVNTIIGTTTYKDEVWIDITVD